MKTILKRTISLGNFPKVKSVKKGKRCKCDFLSQKDIEIIKQSEREFENGEEISAEVVFKELREKYGY